MSPRRTFPFAILAWALFLHPLPAQEAPAQGPAPGDTAAVRSWFPKTYYDAGTVFEGTKVVHVFPFKNPRSKPHQIKWIQKTCSCSQAWLVIGKKEIPWNEVVHHPVTIPPGGGGGVKLLVDMTGIRGVKEAEVTVGLEEKGIPNPVLKIRALGVVYFEAVPSTISLGRLGWDEKKDFSFTVTSTKVKKWKITGWEALPPGVKLDNPKRTEKDGRITYTFHGTLGPGLPPGPAGGTIKLKTDFKNRVVEVSIAAEVKRPYTVNPEGYLGFGRVWRARGKEKVIQIENLDPARELRLLDVKLLEMNRPHKWVKVRVEEEDPGKKILVHVRVVPGAPKGHLRGKIRLHLSHPKGPYKTLVFSAFVR